MDSWTFTGSNNTNSSLFCFPPSLAMRTSLFVCFCWYNHVQKRYLWPALMNWKLHLLRAETCFSKRSFGVRGTTIKHGFLTRKRELHSGGILGNGRNTWITRAATQQASNTLRNCSKINISLKLVSRSGNYMPLCFRIRFRIFKNQKSFYSLQRTRV